MRRSFALLLPAALALITAVRPLQGQFAAGTGALVSPQWLSQHLHDRDLVLLYVGPDSGYTAGHIEGASFVALHDFSTPMAAGTLTLEMPAAPVLRQELEAHGISDRSRVVVVFDSEWVTPATRVLFTLGYAGLGNRASLLDGGTEAWRKAGFQVVTAIPQVAPGHLTTAVTPALVVDNGYVAAHRNTPHAHVVDARAPVYFAGPAVPGHHMATGHVASAVNVPFSDMVDSSNRLLPRAALEARFLAAGVAPGDTVIAYCHVGQQATLVLLGAWMAGHPVRLYDGSFEDWSMRKLPTEGGQ